MEPETSIQMCEINSSSGLILPLTLDDVVSMDDNEMMSYVDDRGWSWVFIAAEAGHEVAINEFIKRGFPLDIEKDGNTPMSLAYENKHYGVVLNLLKANTRYPSNFNKEEASDELKAFLELSNDLHDRIKSDKIENLSEIFTQNCNLRHFYDANNRSALCTAIEHKKFEFAKILLQNDVILGPFESIEVVSRVLTEEEKDQWKEMQLELSQAISNPTIMTIMANTFVGHDEKFVSQRRALVADSLDFLMKLPLVAPNLDVVATARNYKLVFDFNRDSIQYLDLTATAFMNGTFEMSGRVYIAAQKFFDADGNYNTEGRFEVLGVIAHELCHFANYIVYKNMAKPYREDDKESQDKFTEVVEACRAQKDTEKSIWEVFENYKEDMIHAETIVRVPQMLAQHDGEFHDGESVLDQKREDFNPLFDYYENKTIPEFIEALPELRRKANFTEKDEKISKLKKFIIGLCIVIGLLIPFGIGVGLYLYTPTLSWNMLPNSDKSKVIDSTVDFRGVSLKFGELFANDSAVFDSLSSDQLHDVLKGKTSRLSDVINRKDFDRYIFLDYKNMTEGLREHLMSLSVNFQGQQVEISKITSKNSSVLHYLTPTQVLDIFNRDSVEVATEIPSSVKYYIDRYFVDEIVDKNSTNTEIKLDIEGVIAETLDKRIFLLSNTAGEGKSSSFQRLSLKMKENYPWKWVQFVDLKSYVKAFKNAKDFNFKNAEILKDFLMETFVQPIEMQREIFLDRFDSDEVVFIWDGIDEISPLYNSFIINLMSEIEKQSRNIQFMSTRTQYSRKLSNDFHIKAHKLVPLGKAERFELFINYIAVESFSIDKTELLKDLVNKINEYLNNIGENLPLNRLQSGKTLNPIIEEISVKLNMTFSDSLKMFNAIFEGKKVFDSMEKSNNENRFVTNPLLIRMIGELVIEEDFKADGTYNFYSIFEIFLKKKHNIASTKGKVVIEDINKPLLDKKVNIMEIHQAYALKLVFSVYVQSFLSELNWSIDDFDIMNSTSKLAKVEISRYGILNFDSDGNSNFAHLTFAEFLVAQFLIDEIDNLDFNKPDSHMKMFLLGAVLFTDDFEVVRNFLLSYSSIKSNLSSVFSILKSQNSAIMKLESRTIDKNILNFLMVSQFSKYYKNTFNITFNQYLTLKAISFISLKLEDFFDNFDEFLTAFGKETTLNFFTSKDFFGFTMLHEISTLSLLKSYCSRVRQELPLSQIVSLLFSRDNRGKIPMMLNAYRQIENNLDFVKYLWEFSKDYLSNNQLDKKLLLVKDDFQFTILHYSTFTKDKNVFEYVKNIYEAHFTPLEIQEIFIATSQSEVGYFERLISMGRKGVVPKVSEYLSGIFFDNKKRLREFLYFQKDGKTLFDMLKLLNTNYFLEPFVRRMLEDNCDEKHIKTSSDFKVFVFNCLIVTNTSFDEYKKMDSKQADEFLIEEFILNFKNIYESLRYIKTLLDRTATPIDKIILTRNAITDLPLGENFAISSIKQLLTKQKNLEQLMSNLEKSNTNFAFLIKEIASGRIDKGIITFINLIEQDNHSSFFLQMKQTMIEMAQTINVENYLDLVRDIINFSRKNLFSNPDVLNQLEITDYLEVEEILIKLLKSTFDSDEKYNEFVEHHATTKTSTDSISSLLPVLTTALKDSNVTISLEDILSLTSSFNGSNNSLNLTQIINLPIVQTILKNPHLQSELIKHLISDSKSPKASHEGKGEAIPAVLDFVKSLDTLEEHLSPKHESKNEYTSITKNIFNIAVPIVQGVLTDSDSKAVIDKIKSEDSKIGFRDVVKIAKPIFKTFVNNPDVKKSLKNIWNKLHHK